ncbi:MAG: hypothetical protein FJ219_02565, partial [Ignavibacteria bacterium]|nr:hypothetical protein [Ignavibacteria bacterium]
MPSGAWNKAKVLAFLLVIHNFKTYVCVMQFVKYISFMILATMNIIAAEISFDHMTAKSDGKVITIEWRPSIEKGVRTYELERTSTGDIFRSIANIEPKGAQTTYRFI